MEANGVRDVIAYAWQRDQLLPSARYFAARPAQNGRRQ